MKFGTLKPSLRRQEAATVRGTTHDEEAKKKNLWIYCTVEGARADTGWLIHHCII